MVMGTDWNNVKEAINGNVNAHRQIKMNPLVGNPDEQADLHCGTHTIPRFKRQLHRTFSMTHWIPRVDPSHPQFQSA
jgi:hypothetical protein